MSAEIQKGAVDVLGLTAKGTSGITVVAGGATWYDPSTIGLIIAIASFIITCFLGWEKHKLNKLQAKVSRLQREELERNRPESI